MPDFQHELEQLVAGQISELTIKPENFFAFRSVWTNFPQRNEVVGTAQRGGTIVYHFSESGKH
ncbi:hypothetical protein [Schleiferilactobacillus perolens]|jgi:chromosome condensin MukBEF MukE localization factor|uniref:Uncharacterized protein n=1 Tax=Schleiferilactobacillus perolens DSM 12744 TaxID=1423792 RepID=A0A0R1MZ66_9LACO|nr:hypothetical protein [Schleiferilactobacillus perolens]KRL13391.1 hypothetical protein FD09_GL002222 [Schleiferilactobacillus perolens DSM 12744]MCI1893046.1 hypothetical protein [Schleiferilactobacillus harbinensis]MCI1913023.1 hypothetical protein [Schleiferilactobacillus harbinensis]MCI2170287.1 hypothetical protein [Schleiferilactobacillus perolens]